MKALKHNRQFYEMYKQLDETYQFERKFLKEENEGDEGGGENHVHKH